MAPTRTHLTIAQKNMLRAHHADNPRMNHDDLRLWTKYRFKREIGRSTVSTIVSKPQQTALDTAMKHSRASTQRIHGEAGSVDVIDMEKQQKQLRDLLDEYSLADVYNFDKIGLFFRMLPSQSLATKAIRGKKKDKKRITVGLCANMDDSDKLPVVVIRRAKSPRCFRDVDIKTLPVRYYWNAKAWMTRSVWAEWLRDLNMRMHGRKILLLVDNAPGHADIELSNVVIHFLPPNITSFLQLMDAGITRSFKCKYKVQFVRWVIGQIDTGQKSVKMDVLTAIKFTVDAWEGVTATTIRNSWCHTGIVSGVGAAQLRHANDSRRLSDLPELTALIKRLGITDGMDAEDYVCIDDEDPAESVTMTAPCVLEPTCSDASEDEEEDEYVFSHSEAVAAIQQLSVYAFG